MNLPKLEWSDYFSGNPTTTLGPGEYKTTQTYSATNVYILNCLFNGCTSESNGSALYCSNSVTYLLVESSSFFSCKTSGKDGGAIYFSNTYNGQCAVNKVCGYDCYSTYTSSSYSYSFGQFARVYVSDSASNKNYVNYSSVARCVNSNSYSYMPLCLEYGKICCPSVNLSMNKCHRHSGIYCYPFIDSSSVTCSMSYSSLADNIASDHICIGFNANAKYEIKCCNILRNTHTSTTYGIIYINGNSMIKDSCILENKGLYMIYVWSSTTITLSNCTIDKTSYYGNIKTQNTVTKSFILGLNHMSTQNCHSEYDSAGTLTAIPYEIAIRYTCYYYQSRISDFFSLTWIQLLFWTKFQ
jgi:hypothetical protein